ncbi:MAG: arginine--tRNA ligase [Proteobacteria bacterium]|nr:arginine--tRNA ligase [Pseudomonadota bacterium]MBU4289410.1 arginine--tRNA ligase [Pseudomonadota bacterium]MBU4413672.1 arginine--tRNA ligase [Pseudomonadota bacterium]MCG2757936.1 arginine--tRNA ligase [Desulfobacteraceae bacterium]
MKQKIKNMIYNASKDAYDKGDLPSPDFPEIEVEEPKAESHGDFSTNISMVMAAVQKMPPRKIAEAIIKNIDDPDGIIDRTEIAGPGFINFCLNRYSWHPVLREIHERDTLYGASDIGKGKKVQVEFVSANPTGPLHVGHGRGAAVGDSIANILLFCGYNVEKEYYINDSGRQISTLGRSVFMRYKELFGTDIQFPDDCYQGDYIRDLAIEIKKKKEDKLLFLSEEEAISYCARFAADNILSEIKEDLECFGIVFDRWYSEQGLYDSGKVDRVINDFRKQNIIFEDDGALWFRTKDFGDEKNRVVVRNNGLTTYFASDIAYHQDKFDRGFERIIDIWGADHHGYIPRVSAAIEALGYGRDKFDVILIQLVNLLREGEPVAMSTRAGEFVTLRDVINEVGSDAARFIFLTRHYESALDFDLELAKKKTNDNPVYYVQYVHARISSIARKAQERGTSDIAWNAAAVSRLTEPEEIQLIKIMSRYPEIVRCSAEYMEPHRITYFLMNLASAFHAYYNKHRVLTDEAELTLGRLYLVLAVKKIIRNGLALLGVSAPEKM